MQENNNFVSVQETDSLGEQPHHPEQPMLQKERSLLLDEEQKMEIMWDQLTIKVEAKKPSCFKKIYMKEKQLEDKVILKDLKGVGRAGQLTAILGPSGSGKTTLLNFLSGRLVSDNLRVSGKLSVNGLDIESVDVVGDKVAYVMQDDILFPTFTPREAFRFSADLRLSGQSRQEKEEKVEQVIKDLGLSKCADTYIGGEIIKGISGGERKRTSIGVELITNPSVIFLDEPTTGLDSETALNTMLVLRNMAREGRTIISTIHQPSSQIYGCFDQLLLLVQGQLIFQGPPSLAIEHFAHQGYPCPIQANPSDFFMKCMVYQAAGTPQDFSDRIAKMTTVYKSSAIYEE